MSSIQFFYTFEPQFNASTDDVSEHIQFDVLEFKLTEAVSEPYRLEAELVSSDPNIDFAKLLDQPASFTIWQTPPSAAGGLLGFGSDLLGQLGQVGDMAGQLGDKFGNKAASSLAGKASSAVTDKLGSSLNSSLGDKLGGKLSTSLGDKLGAGLGNALSSFGLSSAAFANAKPVRVVHGILSDISLGKTGHRQTHYHIVMEPQLARTMLSSDWKIFQQKTVPDIVAEVFKEKHINSFNFNSQETHLQREFCVEADELDFDFIQRLLAEEGFVYTHLHTNKSHELKITDVIQTLGSITQNRDGETSTTQDEEGNLIVDTVLYNANPAGDSPYPSIFDLTYKEQVRTARQTQRDYTFRNPRYSQQHSSMGTQMPSQSTHYERYDYPGRYKADAAGSPFTETKINALRNDAKIAIATSNDARLQPGLAFELEGHPRSELNQYWRPVSITHHGKQHTAAREDAAGSTQATGYTQTAQLVPATQNWKAPLQPKPLLHGPQIAVVTGPQNEEIYCDEWGRVKVQFPWDRLGKNDEYSSCWIRVTQGWGMGGGDGQQSIPRIGQEVLVGFLNSDPDQPMVIGRANNALNPTPYELPKHKTISTWRSKTHKGEGFNEIRFDDANNLEEIYVHAQKDQNIHVNNDETTFVGNNRIEHVEVDEKIFIGHNRQEQVTHDEAVEIGNDRKHHIISNEYLNIDGTQTIEIGNNRVEVVRNHRKDKTGANHEVEVSGHFRSKVEGEHEIRAGSKIKRTTQVYELGAQDKVIIQGPGGKITIDGSGISFEGNINIKGAINQSALGSVSAIGIGGDIAEAPFEQCSEKDK